VPLLSSTAKAQMPTCRKHAIVPRSWISISDATIESSCHGQAVQWTRPLLCHLAVFPLHIFGLSFFESSSRPFSSFSPVGSDQCANLLSHLSRSWPPLYLIPNPRLLMGGKAVTPVLTERYSRTASRLLGNILRFTTCSGRMQIFRKKSPGRPSGKRRTTPTILKDGFTS